MWIIGGLGAVTSHPEARGAAGRGVTTDKLLEAEDGDRPLLIGRYLHSYIKLSH